MSTKPGGASNVWTTDVDGSRYRHEYVAPNDPRLTYDPRCQRRAQPTTATAKVRAMISDWRPGDTAMLHAWMRRDDELVIIDGAGRWTAAMVAAPDTPLLFKVYADGLRKLDLSWASAKFVALNSVRTVLTLDMFRQKANAGTEPEASLHAALLACGWDVGNSTSEVRATTGIVSAAKKYGLPAVERALQITRAAWGGEVPQGDAVAAVAGLLVRATSYRDEPPDEGVLVKALTGIDQSTIKNRRRTVGSGPFRWAEVIVELYNAKRIADNRLRTLDRRAFEALGRPTEPVKRTSRRASAPLAEA